MKQLEYKIYSGQGPSELMQYFCVTVEREEATQQMFPRKQPVTDSLRKMLLYENKAQCKWLATMDHLKCDTHPTI